MRILKLLEIFYYPTLIILLFVLVAFFYVFRKQLAHRKIQTKHASFKTMLRDASLSFLAFFCFVPTSLICAYCFSKHYGLTYLDMHQYGMVYFVISIFFVILIHDIYYYWMHRMLHTVPFLYKHIHKVHHTSANPTVLTFYAMHPVESFLMSLSPVITIFIVPMSVNALLIGASLHIAYTIYGHSGYEWMSNKFLRQFLNTSLSHNLHHQHIRVNYSYYFIFWDRIMGTLDHSYWQRFEQMFSSKNCLNTVRHPGLETNSRIET